MTEAEALGRMISPGQIRPGKLGRFGGVVQIWTTRLCDKACFSCTQASNLRPPEGASRARDDLFMHPSLFERAVESLKGYFGVVGVFGGNPATHYAFEEICDILARHVPFERRGLWCNNPMTLAKARKMREVYNPAVSNLNVHLDAEAYRLFREGWPEARPFGLEQDSRHSPPYVAMKDVLRKECPGCDGTGRFSYQRAKQRCESVGGYAKRIPGVGVVYYTPDHKEIPLKLIGLHCEVCGGTGKVYDEEKAWELLAGCPINQHWSALIGVFRGELRAWFCEIAGAQAMLHQHEPDYPDTGRELWYDPTEESTRLGDEVKGGGIKLPWWTLKMKSFAGQVRKHCHDCGVPLQGYGELAQAGDEKAVEQVSETHAGVYRPKRKGRKVEVVTQLVQLGVGKLENMTRYLQNAEK